MQPVHPSVALKTEACRGFLEIWTAARGQNLMPRRSDIDPGELKTIMPQIAVVAVSAPGTTDISSRERHPMSPRPILRSAAKA